ncbi:MAG TPA: expansin EXLX1 family cellulose-binding protein [Streptosporangiaceae bacterium]
MIAGRHGWRRARWPWLGLGGVAAVIAVVVVVAGVGQAGGRACAAAVPAAGTVTGTATHYVLSGTGNCSYPSPPADGLFVALSPSEYDGAAACGSYVEVSGPDGSVTAQVIDQCPPCAAGHVDLSEDAFARIAPLSAGLVPVSYRTIADPALPGPVSLRVKEGSSPYWLALLAQNTGNPLASVQVESPPGGWQSLVRAGYNYWIAASGAGPGPFTVRLTDTAGRKAGRPRDQRGAPADRSGTQRGQFSDGTPGAGPQPGPGTHRSPARTDRDTGLLSSSARSQMERIGEVVAVIA